MKQALIDAALADLNVTNPSGPVPGGQKYVVPADLAGKRVMVKVIELAPAHRDLLLERARREVGLLSQIDHPNVVKMAADLVEVGGPPPLAVAWAEEFLEGEDLAKKFGTSCTWDETRAMALDVASGLSALHAKRIVHRDLSARNIRACVDGRYVVLDPGVARHLDRTRVTGLYQPGTRGYISPEHVTAAAQPIPASDVFCLGILMYQALTTKLPIPVGTDEAKYHNALVTTNAPSIGVERPDLTPAQADIVDRCLNRQSGRRFLDADEFLGALAAT